MRYRLIYNLLTTVVIYLVMVGWLVYGNIIFFSDDNDCNLNPETKPMASLMLFLLIIGYVQMMFTMLIVCVLPVIVWLYL